MRILTSEWRELKRMESYYDLWYREVDPRASKEDQELLSYHLGSLYHEALCDLANSFPEDHIPELPTKDDVLARMYELLDERVRGFESHMPPDLLQYIADMRLYALGIISPQLYDAFHERVSEYSSKADEIYGRWLWHTLEEIPLLGEDAVELMDSLRFSQFSVREDGNDLHLSNNISSITFHDAKYNRESIGVHLIVSHSELYQEGGLWELHISYDDLESVISFTSFDIERMVR